MNMYENKINNMLYKLSKSKFRSSFHLRKYMIEYIDEKGMDKIKEHTISFITEKLADSNPKNDGKQTPTKNHPTFIAMHACACCCRGCLEKWHNIPKGKELSREEKNYIYILLMTWIKREYENYK
jgi:hypothetical protein